ncbi:septal ring lytic transglycosylase RlpA family protein [Rhizobium sp. ARZ01]|nr:septal ring lytic transglycosylase RlpA family protein [Rhizobium sp. ARZ01]
MEQFGRTFLVLLASSVLLVPIAWDVSEYWNRRVDGSDSTTQPAVRQSEPLTDHVPSETTRKKTASINRGPTYKSGPGGASIVIRPNVAKATGCGRASWYALYSRTASGERMNPAKLTAAHKSLRFGTKLKVTNTSNGRSVVVRINDRGPFVKGRVLDLSKAAASQIGMISAGHTKVCYHELPSRSVQRPLCSTAPGCSRV